MGIRRQEALEAYRDKRRFDISPEPRGSKRAAEGHAFVVQKHAARRLHYDLRLELDGVMLSWAVTRGPSLVPGEKRLAMHVEDHPIEYNQFEGTIPAGQYGAGTVMIWDRGTWEPEGDPHKGYKKGHLDFRLNGEKLHGRWHLVRMRKRPGERGDPWLLIKSADEAARSERDKDVLEEMPLSVATGRDMDEIAAGKKPAKRRAARQPAEKQTAPAMTASKSASGTTSKPSAKKAAKAAPKSPAGKKVPAKNTSAKRASAKKGFAKNASSKEASSSKKASSKKTPSKKTPSKKTPAKKSSAKTAAKTVSARRSAPRALSAPAALKRAAIEAPQPDHVEARQEKKSPRLRAAPAAKMPEFVPPCLALLSAKAPDSDAWVHEIKFDGYRMQARLSEGEVRLRTRTGLDWTGRFQSIADALAGLAQREALIDGEIVVETAEGVSSFSALQEELKSGRGDKFIYYAFDLLYCDGRDIRALPLIERKQMLRDLLAQLDDGGKVRFSEHFETSGSKLLEEACHLRLEGIVSKRKDAPYRSGRGGEWLKTKCSDRQELVIAGMVPATNDAKAVGSLVLGYYENGVLKYAGRTGTGFTHKSARALWRQLAPLKIDRVPFESMPPEERRARRAIWLEPRMVAEVEVRGWTHGGRVRHAAFKGLREDKDPKEIVREEAAMPASSSNVDRAAPARERSRQKSDDAGAHLTNPDRVYWEDVDLTKRGLAQYYTDVWKWIAPHITGRVLSLVRCPEGAGKQCFFQKHASAGLDAQRLSLVPDDGDQVIAIDSLDGLLALVQAGVLEIHVRGSRVEHLDKADRIVFDLDPGPDVGWDAVKQAAREVQALLQGLELKSFVKTTGGKGLHVVLPVAPTPWDEVKDFARRIATGMAANDPDRFVATAAKRLRDGKIFVDYLRNSREATAIAPYSTRARPGATVSVPVAWSELASLTTPNRYTVANVMQRLNRLKRDPWEGIGKFQQRLPKLGK